MKGKVVVSQKVGFSKWRLFFDLMYFRPWPLPSGGFLKKPADKVLIFLLKTIYFIVEILNVGKISSEERVF